MKLIQEQQNVIDYITNEMKTKHYDREPYFRYLFETSVGGLAGTGKSTVLSYLRKEIKKQFPKLSIAFITLTGKASSVLKEKLESANSLYKTDYVGTIHSLMYRSITEYDRKLKTYVIVGWTLNDPDDILYDLIIVDEASMISEDIYNDLKKLNKSIIFVGDHGQLPPIGDNFNLMQNPQFKLNHIHRQALNSPIIQLSQFVRQHGYVPFNKIFSKDVFKLSWDHPKCQQIWNKINFDENIIVLCGFNATRVKLNKMIRDKVGFKNEKIPYPTERLVCLRNDHTRGIMNGQIGNVLWVMQESHGLMRITLEVDGIADPIETTVSDKCFGEVKYTMYDKSREGDLQRKYASDNNLGNVSYFDFGYTISTHKAQGSSWNKVVVFEQFSRHWDDDYRMRWMYTAITRAEEKLFIISDYWG